jgi:hypothetical protein
LYRAFVTTSEAQILFRKYSERPGCQDLIRNEWEKGAKAPGRSGPANDPRDLGVAGRGIFPVFRTTVTEALCFAEWLGGRLASTKQYDKAAGLGDNPPPEALDGKPAGLAINLGASGPWSVTEGTRDVYKGRRQFVSNGREFTRTLHNVVGEQTEELPLDFMNEPRRVCIWGKSYLSRTPPTAADLKFHGDELVTTPLADVSFRIVLEEK